MDIAVVNFEERPDLYDSQEAICGRAFPVFLYYSETAAAYWEKMIRYYREYQLMLLCKDNIAAVVNCMPLNLDIPEENLPHEAFEWGFQKGIADYESGKAVNAVLGVQIVVPEAFKNKGLSTLAILALKEMCAEKGIETILIPVRPTLKSKYPLIDMDEYRRWTRSDGLPFDPWLRVHVRSQARVGRVCEKAVEIKGTVEQWETWTKMAFPQSGDYVVEGALCPVAIDKEKNLGTYVEPNIWVIYHPQSHNRSNNEQ